MNSTDNDKKKYTKYIINVLSLKSNGYSDLNINQIIFSYGFKEGIVENKDNSLSIKELNTINKSITQNYKHYKLPVTLDPLAYGKLINSINITSSLPNGSKSVDDYSIINETQYIIQVTPLTLFIINQSIDNEKIINKVSIFREGDKVLEYINNESNFMRQIGKITYYYSLDGKLEYFYTEKLTNYMKKKEINKNIDSLYNINSNKIRTLDIETVEEDQSINSPKGQGRGLVLIPYLISYFDGIETRSFFISDYNFTPAKMIQECLKSLLTHKYNGYKIYIQN